MQLEKDYYVVLSGCGKYILTGKNSQSRRFTPIDKLNGKTIATARHYSEAEKMSDTYNMQKSFYRNGVIGTRIVKARLTLLEN